MATRFRRIFTFFRGFGAACALVAVAGGCDSSAKQKPAASPSSATSSSSSPAPSPAKSCRDGVGDDVKMAGRTAGSAAKTGITAAADGIVQVGSATAGLVHGGKEEAKEKWKAGAAETKADARENASETKQEASLPPCK